MTYVLDTVYSWPFWIGSAISMALWKLYCRQKARWLDRHRPLPEGAKHYTARINRLWLAGLALTLSLGYILLTAQKTHDQTIALAQNVARCWSESYKSTRAQIDLNAQNDGITRQQQDLQREYDRATSNFWQDLLKPSDQNISALAPNDPRRQQWVMDRGSQYQETIDSLGVQFDGLVDQRKTLDIERARHPLPESTCGR